MSKYYGVSQLHHGHEWRWIFTEEMIREAMEEMMLPEAMGLEEDYDISEISDEDISWPIGGSNSSGTMFDPLDSEEEIREFLLHGGYGPDLDDPELVDLAEYINTADVDGYCCESCTKEFVEKFNLNAEDLELGDIRYDKSEEMIAALKEAGYKDFDYDNPFYGRNRDMRFSELWDIYEKVFGCEIEFDFSTLFVPLKKEDH